MSNEHNGLRNYLENENPAGIVRFFITDSPSDYIDFQCSECGKVCSVKFFGHKNDPSFCEIQNTAIIKIIIVADHTTISLLK